MKSIIHSIQFKLILFFIAIIISVILINTLIQYNIDYIINAINQTVDSIRKVNDIKQDINSLNYYVNHYLITGDSDSMLEIYGCLNSISSRLKEISYPINSGEEFQYIKNMQNIFDYLNSYAEKLIIYKKSNINFIDVYKDYTDAIEFINFYINKLNEFKINHNMVIYKKIQNGIGIIKGVNNIIIFLWAVVATIISIIFSKNLTLPIVRLAKYSNKVADGNLDIEINNYKTNDEIEVIYTSFANMIYKIKDMLNKLEEKAELERIVNEQKIEFIKYRQALQEAELKSLQAQINPHFLFNTLNTITQIAMFENAQKTYELLLKTSNYLRYSVHNINKIVYLHQEIENIQNYMFIHSIRFGDNIKLELDICRECENALVPSMILQPIIENSIIHGFSKTNEGIIKVLAYKSYGNVVLKVIDNGIGMDKLTLDKLKIRDIVSATSYGIGIENIAKRIEYFYNIKEPIDIHSELNKGTTVTIIFPLITNKANLPNRGEFS